jgi:hypothetical protein
MINFMKKRRKMGVDGYPRDDRNNRMREMDFPGCAGNNS